MQELQHNKPSAAKQAVVSDEEDDEEEMMIDLDQLDDQNREMLLEYLKQEYDKNPGQFQLPKELEGLLKEQAGKKDHQLESVKDIKSQEMVLEDVGGSQQIVGGGQDIEDEADGDEIQEDDEEGAEYLDDQHNR